MVCCQIHFSFFLLPCFFCFSFLFLISRIQLNVRIAVNPKTFGIWSFSKFTLLLAHSCLFRMSLKSCFVQAAGCGRSESHMDTHTHTHSPSPGNVRNLRSEVLRWGYPLSSDIGQLHCVCFFSLQFELFTTSDAFVVLRSSLWSGN